MAATRRSKSAARRSSGRKATLSAKEAAVQRYIYKGLNLDNVKRQAAKDHRWGKKDVEDAEQWYRNFLWVAYRHRGKRVYGLTDKADYLWHAHILFTQEYERACRRIFGRFLHHVPGTLPETPAETRLKKQAIEWYREEFDKQYAVPILEDAIKRMEIPCYCH